MILEVALVAILSKGTYVVQPGDTLSGIGAETGHSWYQIYEANDLVLSNPNEIRPGMVLQLPQNSDRSLGFSSSEDTVVVMPQQSLSSIGRNVGIGWQEIARLNGLSHPYIIHPGQEIRIR